MSYVLSSIISVELLILFVSKIFSSFCLDVTTDDWETDLSTYFWENNPFYVIYIRKFGDDIFLIGTDTQNGIFQLIDENFSVTNKTMITAKSIKGSLFPFVKPESTNNGYQIMILDSEITSTSLILLVSKKMSFEGKEMTIAPLNENSFYFGSSDSSKGKCYSFLADYDLTRKTEENTYSDCDNIAIGTFANSKVVYFLFYFVKITYVIPPNSSKDYLTFEYSSLNSGIVKQISFAEMADQNFFLCFLTDNNSINCSSGKLENDSIIKVKKRMDVISCDFTQLEVPSTGGTHDNSEYIGFALYRLSDENIVIGCGFSNYKMVIINSDLEQVGEKFLIKDALGVSFDFNVLSETKILFVGFHFLFEDYHYKRKVIYKVFNLDSNSQSEIVCKDISSSIFQFSESKKSISFSEIFSTKYDDKSLIIQKLPFYGVIKDGTADTKASKGTVYPVKNLLFFYEDITEQVIDSFKISVFYQNDQTNSKECSFLLKICSSLCQTCENLGNSISCSQCIQGYYFAENQGNKCFDKKSIEAISSAYYLNKKEGIYKICDSKCQGCDDEGNCLSSPTGDVDLPQNGKPKDVFDQASDNILSLIKKDQKTFEGDDYVIEVCPTDQVNEDNGSISTINLGECEKALRQGNGISADEKLYILKMDTPKENSRIAEVVYKVFDSKGRELDMKYCDNINIEISYPLINTTGLDIPSAKDLMNNYGVDVYNSSDSFFNDICKPYSINGYDVVLSDRRSEIYQNESFCSDGCEYQGLNYTTMKVKCDCLKKVDTETQVKNAFSSSITSSNIFVINCYNLLSSKKKILNNIGFWFMLTLFVIQLITLIFYFTRGNRTLYAKLNSIPKPVHPRSNKYSDDSTNIGTSQNSMLIRSPLQKSQIVTYSALVHSLEPKSNSTAISEEKFPTTKYVQTAKRLDSIPYEQAISKDKRNCCSMLCLDFKEKETFCRPFHPVSKYELICVNFSQLILTISLQFTLNALFFTDDVISKRYHNNLSFLTDKLRSVYSCVVNVIIIGILKSLSNFTRLLETLVIETSHDKDYLFFLKKFFDKLKKKLIIFFTLETLIIIFCWYYLTLFCAVYSSSQVEWFKGGWFSSLISIGVAIGISLGVSLLRYIAIGCKKKRVYNVSIFIRNIMI